MLDVIIVGGSYAGMASAFQLARARRRVLIIDAGQPRDRFAARSYGLLTQEDHSPSEIAATAKTQLLAYPTVEWQDDTVVSITTEDGTFTVCTKAGVCFESSRVLLATGIHDDLPAIPGLKERWGRTVFHCPYRHGYELDQGRLGVISNNEHSLHQALLLPEWGETTFFLNGVFEPDTQQRALLNARSIRVERALVEQVKDKATVRLVDGRELSFAGLFIAPNSTVVNPLADGLGCEYIEAPFGGFIIKTDDFKQTSVNGLFACGDAAHAVGALSFANADGVMAGVGIHHSLIPELR
jgi:thioredoxin reductase